jgi:myo-inositol-1(or 4)-monophosphatase
MDDLERFTVDLALETGGLLLEFFDLFGIHASPKPDHTVVTEADLAADRLITRRIQENFPADGIISEESSHFLHDPHSPTWVVDPLDGTTNFSLGLPVWGISIARLLNGYPELGVLYFPIIDELYVGRSGSGAYLNHRQISTRAPDPAEPMSFFTCCSRSFRTFNISVPYKPRIMGSSAYSFCLVARGSALIGLETTPKIWDLAAAWLLVEEAGGIIKPFETGQIFPIHSDVDYNTASWAVIATTTPKLFEQSNHWIKRKDS